MEKQQRKSIRRRAQYNVLLYHNSYPVKSCKVLNKSHDGLYIETGPVIFPLDIPLEIGFEATVKGKLSRFRLPVKVVHIANDGMGLKFDKVTNYQQIVAQNIFHLVTTASHEFNKSGTTFNIL